MVAKVSTSYRASGEAAIGGDAVAGTPAPPQERRIVAISPDSGAGNPFIEQVAAALEAKGCAVVPFKTILVPEHRDATRYVILNWYDEIRGPLPMALARIAKRRLAIARCKSNGVRLVTVVHNRHPHDSSSSAVSGMSNRFRLFLCRQSDAIVGLCKATEEVLRDLGLSQDEVDEKFHVVPHPNYAGHYEAPLDEPRDNPSDPSFNFLLVGNIRKYKNIELVISVARRFHAEGLDARFLVAGRCTDPAYIDELKQQAPATMEIREGFVSEEDMARYIHSSDALILPYDSSSLNSGVCLLAFTLGRTVICPAIGTLEDIPESLVYEYSYAEDSGHYQALLSSARRAYQDKLNDPVSFSQRGRQLQAIVLEDNSLEVVGDRLMHVFKSVEEQKGTQD